MEIRWPVKDTSVSLPKSIRPSQHWTVPNKWSTKIAYHQAVSHPVCGKRVAPHQQYTIQLKCIAIQPLFNHPHRAIIFKKLKTNNKKQNIIRFVYRDRITLNAVFHFEYIWYIFNFSLYFFFLSLYTLCRYHCIPLSFFRNNNNSSILRSILICSNTYNIILYFDSCYLIK